MLQLRNKSSSKVPLWLVEKKYTLGSDGSSDITVSGAGVLAKHAELLINGDVVELINLVGGTALTINGEAVSDKAQMKPGDMLKLGDEELELLDPKASKKASPKPDQAAEGWALKALNTALADKHFPLSGSHVIGRSQECDISLGVVHLSRKHAKVDVTPSGLKIEDLNSSNGTYVNGKKVNVAKAIAGDEVSFDTLRFRVIGPIIDQDKTTMRPSSDGNLTTIRPALTMPDNTGGQKASEKPAASPKPKPRTSAPKPAKVAPKVKAQSVSEEEPRSTGMIFAGVAVIVGAAIAWFFLK